MAGSSSTTRMSGAGRWSDTGDLLCGQREREDAAAGRAVAHRNGTPVGAGRWRGTRASPRPTLRVPSGRAPPVVRTPRRRGPSRHRGCRGRPSATQISTICATRAAETQTWLPAGSVRKRVCHQVHDRLHCERRSAWTSRGSAGASKRTSWSASAGTWRSASSTRSSTSSQSAWGVTPPSSRRVTVRRFSHGAPQPDWRRRRMARVRVLRRSESRTSPAARRTSALPEMEGERRAQVVGDGAEQVGAGLLVAGAHGGPPRAGERTQAICRESRRGRTPSARARGRRPPPPRQAPAPSRRRAARRLR